MNIRYLFKLFLIAFMASLMAFSSLFVTYFNKIDDIYTPIFDKIASSFPSFSQGVLTNPSSILENAAMIPKLIQDKQTYPQFEAFLLEPPMVDSTFVDPTNIFGQRTRDATDVFLRGAPPPLELQIITLALLDPTDIFGQQTLDASKVFHPVSRPTKPQVVAYENAATCDGYSCHVEGLNKLGARDMKAALHVEKASSRLGDYVNNVSKAHITASVCNVSGKGLPSSASNSTEMTGNGDTFWNHFQHARIPSVDATSLFLAKDALSGILRALWTGAGNFRLSVQEFSLWIASIIILVATVVILVYCPAMDKILELGQEPEEQQQQEKTTPYGGLYNLGNTCYMASALQMLASLEGFIQLVNNKEEQQQPCCAMDNNDNKLRTVFLNVMQRLRTQRVVNPSEFKKVMGEKSPMFVGHQQEDSHEFLTEFWDMLHEEYTMKESMDEEEDALTHRQEQQHEEGEVDPNKLSAGSFSQLDVDGTGDLLHDHTTTATTVCERHHQQAFASRSSMTISNSCCTPGPPHGCKLIGGCMNTAEVVFIPYESSSNNKLPKSSDGAPAAAAASFNHVMKMDDSDGADDNGSTNSEQQQTEEKKDDVSSSPVDSYFMTYVRVRLTCDSCKYTRAKIEKFWHLSIDIGSDDSGSVEDGLRRFFAPERREVKCKKCSCDTATQTTEITQLPRALLLHFKRFLVDVSPDYSSISYRKNRSMVAFDDKLLLEAAGVGGGGVLVEFLAPDCSLPDQQQQQSVDGVTISSVNQPYYSLVSVVNHIGSSASCGHYTADAKRLYYSLDGDDDGVVGTARREWTRFNDAHVSRITSKQAIEESRKTAYMVLYELSL